VMVMVMVMMLMMMVIMMVVVRGLPKLHACTFLVLSEVLPMPNIV
jgi:hypothetical protein